MVTVYVTYDGQFAEVTRCHRETVEVPGTTVADLVMKLTGKYGKGFSDLALDRERRGTAPGVALLGDGRRLSVGDTLNNQQEVTFLVSFPGG